jgi:hypothetical protein
MTWCDLYFAIVSESASGVVFESSSGDVRVVKMGICRGVDCSAAEVSLNFKGARGDRRIFSSGDAFTVGAESHTVLGFDSSGSVIVKRVVTIKKN